MRLLCAASRSHTAGPPPALALACLLINVLTSTAAAASFWQRTAGPTGGEIRQLVSVNGDALFALASELRRSTNDGGSWEPVQVPFRVAYVTEGPNSTLWAAGPDTLAYSGDLGATWNTVTSPGDVRRLRFAAGRLYALRYDRVLVSDDNGLQWTSLLQLDSLRDLAIDAAGALYVITYNVLWRSADGGTTWAPVPSVSVIVDGALLEPDPAGGLWIGVPAWSDYGGPWGGLYHWDGVHTVGPLFFDSVSSLRTMPDGSVLASCIGVGQFYGSYGGGVWRRAPGATDWQFLGAGGYAVTGVVQCSNGALFASTMGLFVDYGAAPTAGVLRASQPGAQWRTVNRGLDFGRVTTLAAGDGRVYAACEGRLQWTDDQGRTWSGGGEPRTWQFTTLRAAPDGPLYAVGQGEVWRSQDDGASWEFKGPGSIGAMRAIAVFPNGWVLAGGIGGLWATVSHGDTWNHVGTFPQDDPVTGVEVGPADRIFVLTESAIDVSSDLGMSWQRVGSFAAPLGTDAQHLAIAADGHTVYTFDWRGGHAWIETGAGWAEHMLPALTYVPRAAVVGPDGYLYAAGSMTWRLPPGGEQWETLDTQGPDAFWGSAPDLVLDDRGYLYAGTWQNGVLRSKLPVRSFPSDALVPSVAIAGAPAPNPFRNRTSFALGAPRGTPALLTVFDVRGRRIDTTRMFTPGIPATLEWTAPPALPGGIYYWELRTGNDVRRGRMTLVK